MTREILAMVIVLAQAVAPQPASQSGEDTAEIRGRVVDKETGQPLPYAQVTIAERTLNLNRTVLTDDAGVFRFTRLPPGQYDGIAHGGPYRGTHDFAELPGSSAPRVIELAKGTVRDMSIALPRTRAIPVRVVDEFGTPLSDLYLRVYEAPAMKPVRSPFNLRTDDRGRMRVSGLPPGRYVVCADSNGAGRMVTARAPVRERLLSTCYPSAANEADAEPVVVGSGPIDEIEIRMRRGRTFTISGMVLDASGAPATNPQVGFTVFRGGGGSGTVSRTMPDGRFRFDNVSPGFYAIEASVGGPGGPQDRRAREAGFVPVRVVDSDAEGLVVTLSRSVDVPGRFVLEDPTQQLPTSQYPFTVMARLAGDFLPRSGSGIYSYSRADRTFTLAGVFGSRTLDIVGVPAGWYVKHVRYRGDDVIDKAIDFARSGATDSLDVVLSNRGATVTGRVLDDIANPVRKATVWLLRADGDTVTAFATEASTSANGEFRFGPLRAGEYVVVAFATRGREFDRADRARAAKLSSLGERVRLTEYDERAIDLRVIKEEPR